MRFEPFVRHRLIERIQKASQYRVTLIAASAGFGKSTLLRQFLTSYPSAYIRYDVRADHASLLSFVRGFAEALAVFVPHLRSSFATAYESARQAADPSAALAEWVHENIKDIEVTIVIDDFQHVEDQPDVLHFMIALVESSTGFQRWIFSTRTASVFPVALWWERGSMALPIEEAELQFYENEAIEVARECGLGIASADIGNLWEITAGWPMAFLLGLSIGGGLEGTSALAMRGRTREIVYQTLAKRAFAQATEKARRFMLETCKFPTIDRSELKNAHISVDESILAEIEGFGTFFERVSKDAYRYPDLFREYLEQTLAQIGENAPQRALLRAARALEENSQFSAALKKYVEAGSIQDMLRILEEHGFQLIESGNSDAVQAAADAVAQNGAAEQPAVLGLRAVIESARGRYDVSDAWFRMAIDQAQTDALRVELSNRFAEAMLHRYRADCIALLEPFVDYPGLRAEQRARVYSTLSTAYVLGQRFGDALLLMHRALNVLGASSKPELKASVYQQAAWISLFTGNIEGAKQYGAQAVEFAAQTSLNEVAARAHSVLYSIAIDVEDDPETAMKHLRSIADCGLKCGSSTMRQFALFGMYDIEAESGNLAVLHQLERSLEMFEFSYGDQMSLEGLVPSKAMRHAGNGDFKQAYELVADSAERQVTDDRKALRWSEIALYAAACGNDVEAKRALSAATSYLDDLDIAAKRTFRTKLNVVLAFLVEGRVPEAAEVMNDLSADSPAASARIRKLTGVVNAILLNWNGALNYGDILCGLRDLRAQYMGGVAALLEALPRSLSVI